MSVPRGTFAGAEYRRRISPFFGADGYKPGKQLAGPVAEEDNPARSRLRCRGANPYPSRGNVHVGRAELQRFGRAQAGINAQGEQC